MRKAAVWRKKRLIGMAGAPAHFSPAGTSCITPAAAAQLLTRRLPTMMAVAAAIGVLSNVIGLYLSFYLNIASGPAMVLTATGIFLLVFIFAPERGVLWRRLARRQTAATPAPVGS